MNAPTHAGTQSVTVRDVTPHERDAWQSVYRGYRDFYEKPHDPAVFDTVWGWINDPTHETRCLVVEVDGDIVGLAHYRSFARPLVGATGIFLDDLFTTPAARGRGAGKALLTRLAEVARDEGATVVRWITADDNVTARRLYDAVATETPWVTYDLAPAE